MKNYPWAPWMLIVLGLGLAFTGCQPAEVEEEEVEVPATMRLENHELGIAIAALTPAFRLVSNEGAVIELAPAAADKEGTLTISAGEPESGGINLVAAVEEHKSEILERPGGDYKGQREMVTPLGTTFYSRGRYQGERGEVEEVAVYMIHPRQDRQLRLLYRYPAGEDTAERLQDEVFEVLGELEGLDQPAADGREPVP